MSQYQTGTITLISGSQSVSGEGTAWLTNASVGDLLKKRSENAFYTIGAVTTDTTLDLTANYVGTSCSGELYTITKDFTDNYDVPEIWTGDKDWAYHVTYGFRIFDSELKTVEESAAGTQTVVDHGTSTDVTLTSSDFNKIHIFSPSGEGHCSVTLPDVGSDYIGKWLDIRKRASEWVELNCSSGTIHNVTRCLNETNDPDAAIVLTLETATRFGAFPILGVWNFTSSGES